MLAGCRTKAQKNFRQQMIDYREAFVPNPNLTLTQMIDYRRPCSLMWTVGVASVSRNSLTGSSSLASSS